MPTRIQGLQPKSVFTTLQQAYTKQIKFVGDNVTSISSKPRVLPLQFLVSLAFYNDIDPDPELPPKDLKYFNPVINKGLSKSSKEIVSTVFQNLKELLNPFSLDSGANEGLNLLMVNEENFSRLMAITEAGPKLPALLLEHAKDDEEAVKTLTEAFTQLTGTKTMEEAQAVLQTRLNASENAGNGNGNLTETEAKGGLLLTLKALQGNLKFTEESPKTPELTYPMQAVIKRVINYVFTE
jgi:hypothetical protein